MHLLDLTFTTDDTNLNYLSESTPFWHLYFYICIHLYNSISGCTYLAWPSQSVPTPCLCWRVGRPLVGLLHCTGSVGWYTGCLWCWTDSIPSISKVIYLHLNWHNLKWHIWHVHIIISNISNMIMRSNLS